MFRFLIAATAIALSAGPALANGHGGGDPAPPKPEATTAPAKVVLTKQGPTLVDLKGMTLYTYERDTTGKTSNCNGKCAESFVPLPATVDAKAIGDFTVISRNDGSKMWAYRYRPLYTSPADKAPGDANGNATTLQWRVARPEN
ncbi:COG4315 family predicted lipoprotein [Bradyrhizobium barranii]|jgi:predicted lipoprotein with Yx(FWY)xxD motif|uniref:COG4315 family predicted lipoprotein n=1 Tax=Bradyrhizobium TaxID=374 RepID=UPI003F2094B2